MKCLGEPFAYEVRVLAGAALIAGDDEVLRAEHGLTRRRTILRRASA
jgi:hypothetical protein